VAAVRTRLLLVGSALLVVILSGCGSRTSLAGFDGTATNSSTGGSSSGGGTGGFPSGGSASGGTGNAPSFSYLDYFKSPSPDDALYGSRVALSADGLTMAVGSPLESSSAVGINGDPFNRDLTWSGAVFIYVRQGDVWTLQAYIKAQVTDIADQFGTGLDLSASGDRLAVGAPSESSSAVGVDGDAANTAAPQSGAAYVFSRVAGIWTQDAYIKATNTGAGDTFGGAVSLSSDGSTLAVGATGESSSATQVQGDQSDNSKTSSGAAYVLVDAGAGWTHQAYLKAPNSDLHDSFGSSLALAGDGTTLVVGAPQEDSAATGVNQGMGDEGATFAGSAYVFERSGSTWSATAYLKAINTAEHQLFGSAVDISGVGNTIAVGAIHERSLSSGINGDPFDESGSLVGAVYVLERSGDSWAHGAYIKASNPQSAWFGSGLGLTSDGNGLLIGAIHEASAGVGIDGDQTGISNFGAGAAYLFVRSPPSWQQTAYLKANNTALSGGFGHSVALSEDADIAAIGAPTERGASPGINGDPTDQAAIATGAVYVYTLD
jgi:hypothetical protein